MPKIRYTTEGSYSGCCQHHHLTVDAAYACISESGHNDRCIMPVIDGVAYYPKEIMMIAQTTGVDLLKGEQL